MGWMYDWYNITECVTLLVVHLLLVKQLVEIYSFVIFLLNNMKYPKCVHVRNKCNHEGWEGGSKERRYMYTYG